MTRASTISLSRKSPVPRDTILRANRARQKRPNVGKSVGSFVPRLAQKAFEKYGFSTVALLTDWPAIIGPDLAKCTKPEKLKWPRKVAIRDDVEIGCEGRPGATLILRVEPARALDVQYSTTQIVDRINSYFGYRAVADLRLQQVPLDIGQRRSSRLAPPPPAPRPQGSGQGTELPPDRDASARIAAVADEKLRSSLERLQAGIFGRSTTL
ncbi:MAG: DciA family protein [Alphaproteobacteria bacterium]|nr:DciA family protein [Alphaproteobacteria bacterium]